MITCTACLQTYDFGSGHPFCQACRNRPCFACAKPWHEHALALHPSGAVPRMPCAGLRSRFYPDIPRPTPATPDEEAQACARCTRYRMALHAIAEAARDGAPVGGVADLAELALMD